MLVQSTQTVATRGQRFKDCRDFTERPAVASPLGQKIRSEAPSRLTDEPAVVGEHCACTEVAEQRRLTRWIYGLAMKRARFPRERKREYRMVSSSKTNVIATESTTISLALHSKARNPSVGRSSHSERAADSGLKGPRGLESHCFAHSSA
eukprot:6781537-Prymnesium_polylepis.2